MAPYSSSCLNNKLATKGALFFSFFLQHYSVPNHFCVQTLYESIELAVDIEMVKLKLFIIVYILQLHISKSLNEVFFLDTSIIFA